MLATELRILVADLQETMVPTQVHDIEKQVNFMLGPSSKFLLREFGQTLQEQR